MATGEAGSTLAITAFKSALGGAGNVIASLGLMMFAGSTVLAFCTFIGLTCENVFGKTGRWIGQIGFVSLPLSAVLLVLYPSRMG